MRKEMTCIVCPIGCALSVEKQGDSYKVSGNKCIRGEKYAIEEMTSPRRIITSTIRVEGGVNPVTSVKTSSGIPKAKIFEFMDMLSDMKIEAPVKVGQKVITDLYGMGIDVIITKSCAKVNSDEGN